ncbi:MAG TPA: HipA N-terminal domain-containing protein [bacterium]|nr:HipA N-terminal domain-containing protein [bacterium]
MARRSATVLMNDRVAGRIEESERGYRFTYDPSYRADATALPVSRTLPLREEPYESPVLFSFFDGLIPEGWLLDIAAVNWKLNPRDRFGLLLACCRECIGAARIVPEEAPHE